jgi:hypothetical protein
LAACLLVASAAPLAAEDKTVHTGNSTDNSAAVREPEITPSDRDHWAYRPLSRAAIPQVDDRDWPAGPIDRFMLQRLESEGLRPAARADRRVLIRRLSWDLRGLPPSEREVDAFLADRHPDAYERLVDRMLASEDFGHRWGQLWLDQARFAETDGFEHDRIRSRAWHYRDWVIEALNNDLPFDDFVRHQIAGDLIEDSDPDSVTATAFCLSGPDMPDINSIDERRHVLLNEITSTVGSVFLGLQVGCAQCHDHKFDAISQADFYRLRACFDSSIRLQKNKSVDVLATFDEFPRTHLMIRGDWRRPGPPVQPGVLRIVNIEGRRVDEHTPPRLALADWLVDPEHPLTARVFVNRVWQTYFGTGLSAASNDFGVMGEDPSHPHLLDYLAGELIRGRWSVKRLHRAIVLSSTYQTSSFFPSEKDRQTDWRRARQVDPDNRLLSHFPRRRLDAEALRDGLLSVAGMLNREPGGPGVRPPLPPEMVRTLKHGQWDVTPSVPQHHRRSIYLFARRNLRYPFFATFDRPTADQPCMRRDTSTTAIQSLTLLNATIMMDVSETLARRLENTHPRIDQQIDAAYRRVYSRPPEPGERELSRAFLSSGGRTVDLCRALLNSNEFLYVD